MIDSLSLVLSHILMFFVVCRLLTNPDVNVEPDQTGRHFKNIGPKANPTDEPRA